MERLNSDKGYLSNSRDVRLLPGVGEAIKKINAKRIQVIIVTNQSGVERGVISLESFHLVTATICDHLRRCGAYYDALYYCPHIPSTSCFCRKPKPGLLLQAALDYKLDLKRCLMVGDKSSDIQAGRAAGCKTILIGKQNSPNILPDFAAQNLLQAIPIIFELFSK